MKSERRSGQGCLEKDGRFIVEHLGGRWAPGGAMCRCPVHHDHTPSLSVRPGQRRLLFHCFAGCANTHIIRALLDMGLLCSSASSGGPDGDPGNSDDARRNRAAAARIWGEARPVKGTAAETYLLKRGLAQECAELRFHPRAADGSGPNVRFRPALIAAVRDDSGLVAVHRTFLDAAADGAAVGPRKRALGCLGEGAVRLCPPRGGALGWAEGIETAMAATILSGIPCWATLGTERFARVALPAPVQHLILFLDHDEGGRRAEILARRALGGTAVEIDARYPPVSGFDWNDTLRGLAAPLT